MFRLTKLCGLKGADAEKNEGEIERELRTVRNWKSNEHPLWLIFELEQGIQIRPKQGYVLISME